MLRFLFLIILWLIDYILSFFNFICRFIYFKTNSTFVLILFYPFILNFNIIYTFYYYHYFLFVVSLFLTLLLYSYNFTIMQFDFVLSDCFNHLNYLISNYDSIFELFNNLLPQLDYFVLGLDQDNSSIDNTGLDYDPKPGAIVLNNITPRNIAVINNHINNLTPAQLSAFNHHNDQMATAYTDTNFLVAKANLLNSNLYPNDIKAGYINFFVDNNIQYWNEVAQSPGLDNYSKNLGNNRLNFYWSQRL